MTWITQVLLCRDCASQAPSGPQLSPGFFLEALPICPSLCQQDTEVPQAGFILGWEYKRSSTPRCVVWVWHLDSTNRGIKMIDSVVWSYIDMSESTQYYTDRRTHIQRLPTKSTLLLASRVYSYFLIPFLQSNWCWRGPFVMLQSHSLVSCTGLWAATPGSADFIPVGILSLYLVLVPKGCPVECLFFPMLLVFFLLRKQVAAVRPNLF